jgi:hypothetical protein
MSAAQISRSREFYEVPFWYDTAVHLRLMLRLNASADPLREKYLRFFYGHWKKIAVNCAPW